MRSRCSIAGALYWYNVTPKDNETISSTPANGIYQYEQHVTGIDPKPSPPEVRSNVYQVGKPVWVKPGTADTPPDFTMDQFSDSAGQWHTRSMQKTFTDVTSKLLWRKTKVTHSKMGVMVICEPEGQHSSAQLMSEEDTKNEDDQTRRDGGNAGNLTEQCPTLP